MTLKNDVGFGVWLGEGVYRISPDMQVRMSQDIHTKNIYLDVKAITEGDFVDEKSEDIAPPVKLSPIQLCSSPVDPEIIKAGQEMNKALVADMKKCLANQITVLEDDLRQEAMSAKLDIDAHLGASQETHEADMKHFFLPYMHQSETGRSSSALFNLPIPMKVDVEIETEWTAPLSGRHYFQCQHGHTDCLFCPDHEHMYSVKG